MSTDDSRLDDPLYRSALLAEILTRQTRKSSLSYLADELEKEMRLPASDWLYYLLFTAEQCIDHDIDAFAMSRQLYDGARGRTPGWGRAKQAAVKNVLTQRSRRVR